MISRTTRVIVVGGGIGGLAAAIALRHIGLQVQVLEKSVRLESAAGAGLVLQPNAMSALATLGLENTLRSAGMPVHKTTIHKPDGSIILEQELEQEGPQAVSIHRGELHRILVEQLADQVVRTSVFISRIHDTDRGVDVILDDGERLSADVLIGADGVHSQVRRHLWGQQCLQQAGYACWRGITPEIAAVGTHAINTTWGHSHQFGYVPIGGGRLYWFATLPLAEASQPHASKELLVRRFGDWHAPIPRLLDEIAEDSILRHTCGDLLLNSHWGRGRVTLLGDAAHPMTPNLAQGAGMAIEDAITCAACAKRADSVEEWFRTYERQRSRRTKRMLLASRRVGKIAHGNSLLTRFVRDQLLARLPAELIAWSAVPTPARPESL